jgi:hypothetical protein
MSAPLKKKRRKKGASIDRRGVALIMVLVITTIMGAISADLANSSAVNVRAAANARDQLQAYFHARSAVELELFLLRFQGQVKGAIDQLGIGLPLFELSSFLVSSDTMKGLLTRGETPTEEKTKGSFALDKPFGEFEGSFWIEEVVDENRKININLEGLQACNMMHVVLGALIDDPKYDPLFENIGDSRDPLRNRLEIIANIADWVDGNDNVDPVCAITGDMSQSSVAEDTRYDHLPYNVSYKPKNGQMTSLAELRMVPGVNDAFMRLFAPQLTVWSDKKGIAMQTASDLMLIAVVRAISGTPVQPGDAEKYQKFLQEKALALALPPGKLTAQTFELLLNAAEIRYDPAILKKLTDAEMLRFDDVSSVYRITALGRVNDTTSTLTVVWRDDKGLGEIFYWREE